MGGGRPLSSFDELLSMAGLTVLVCGMCWERGHLSLSKDNDGHCCHQLTEERMTWKLMVDGSCVGVWWKRENTACLP